MRTKNQTAGGSVVGQASSLLGGTFIQGKRLDMFCRSSNSTLECGDLSPLSMQATCRRLIPYAFDCTARPELRSVGRRFTSAPLNAARLGDKSPCEKAATGRSTPGTASLSDGLGCGCVGLRSVASADRLEACPTITVELFTAFSRWLCDLAGVKTFRTCSALWVLGILIVGSRMPLHAGTNGVTTNAAGASPEKDAGAKVASAPAGPLDFSSFKVVGERNIFNGNRSGQRMAATRSSTQQRSVRVESFSLVGTLLSEDKDPVAFFDGSSSGFRKALKAGGTIGEFTVQDILHAGVRLVSGANVTEVRVGSGMRREDEGLWKSTASATSYTPSSSRRSSQSSSPSDSGSDSNAGGSTGSSSEGSSASGADANEILKRLMEKREKE